MVRFVQIRQHLFFHWPVIVLFAIFSFIFYSLLSSHMLYEKAGALYSGGSTWGDLALHATIISGIEQRGAAALKENPIYADHKFSYSFAYDAFSALLMRIGFSLRASLFWPSFILILIFTLSIYWLTFSVAKSRAAGFIAPFIFSLTGRRTGWNIFGLIFRQAVPI